MSVVHFQRRAGVSLRVEPPAVPVISSSSAGHEHRANLPTNWNGGLYMFGNGGFAGESFETAGRAANRARSLKAGFPTAATDMFHCGGGIGTSTFDSATPLVAGLKKAKPAAFIPAARIVNGQAIRTRPLCPWPEVARYKGSGSIDDAPNFTYRRPRIDAQHLAIYREFTATVTSIAAPPADEIVGCLAVDVLPGRTLARDRTIGATMHPRI